MSEQDIARIEIDIKEAKHAIDILQALRRLSKNKDFKTIISKGYLEDEATRCVLLKADDQFQTEERQQKMNNSINAIGHFHQYLLKIEKLGLMAQQAIEEQRNTRDEIMKEVVN